MIPIAALTTTQPVQLTLSIATQSTEVNATNVAGILYQGVFGVGAGIALVDPVPDLVNTAGDGLVSSYDALSTAGTP